MPAPECAQKGVYNIIGNCVVAASHRPTNCMHIKVCIILYKNATLIRIANSYLGCGQWMATGSYVSPFVYMHPVQVTVPGLSVNYPDVCTKEPINSNSAFCHQHHKVATHHNYPTDV